MGNKCHSLLCFVFYTLKCLVLLPFCISCCCLFLSLRFLCLSSLSFNYCSSPIFGEICIKVLEVKQYLPFKSFFFFLPSFPHWNKWWRSLALRMNGFQVSRWIGRSMILPLWGLERGKIKCADNVTNILTAAARPGWISKGFRCGRCKSEPNRRSSRQGRLCMSVYPADNYFSLAINCRRSDNAGAQPLRGGGVASIQLMGWRALRRTLMFVHSVESEGQENRWSKVRRFPKWLRTRCLLHAQPAFPSWIRFFLQL